MIDTIRTTIHRLTLREGWHIVSLKAAPCILAFWNGFYFEAKHYGVAHGAIFRAVETREIDRVVGRLRGSMQAPIQREVNYLRNHQQHNQGV